VPERLHPLDCGADCGCALARWSEHIRGHHILRGALAHVDAEHFVHQLVLPEIDVAFADRWEQRAEDAVRGVVVLAKERRRTAAEVRIYVGGICVPNTFCSLHEREHFGDLLLAHRRWRPARARACCTCDE